MWLGAANGCNSSDIHQVQFQFESGHPLHAVPVVGHPYIYASRVLPVEAPERHFAIWMSMCGTPKFGVLFFKIWYFAHPLRGVHSAVHSSALELHLLDVRIQKQNTDASTWSSTEVQYCSAALLRPLRSYSTVRTVLSIAVLQYSREFWVFIPKYMANIPKKHLP